MMEKDGKPGMMRRFMIGWMRFRSMMIDVMDEMIRT